MAVCQEKNQKSLYEIYQASLVDGIVSFRNFCGERTQETRPRRKEMFTGNA